MHYFWISCLYAWRCAVKKSFAAAALSHNICLVRPTEAWASHSVPKRLHKSAPLHPWSTPLVWFPENSRQLTSEPEVWAGSWPDTWPYSSRCVSDKIITKMAHAWAYCPEYRMNIDIINTFLAEVFPGTPISDFLTQVRTPGFSFLILSFSNFVVGLVQRSWLTCFSCPMANTPFGSRDRSTRRNVRCCLGGGFVIGVVDNHWS